MATARMFILKKFGGLVEAVNYFVKFEIVLI